MWDVHKMCGIHTFYMWKSQKIWNTSDEYKLMIEKQFPNVIQHLGNIGTFIPNSVKGVQNDKTHQLMIAEEIVRCARARRNETTGNYNPKDKYCIGLQSYCSETESRLHNDGFLGVEILIPTRCQMFLDNRLPLHSVYLYHYGTRISKAELCMGKYGQIFCVFFMKPIPISAGIEADWFLEIEGIKQSFDYENVEVYWIFGKPEDMSKPYKIEDTACIDVFQYGNTNWQDNFPFQHKKTIISVSDLYTNSFLLDENGNVHTPRYGH